MAKRAQSQRAIRQTRTARPKGRFFSGKGEGGFFQSNDFFSGGLMATRSPGPLIQTKLGDGHDLQSAKFAGNFILEATYDGERTVKNWSVGTHVSALQQALLDDGQTLPDHGKDGKFGDETQTAVENYQIKHNLFNDPFGQVGAETMAHMDKANLGGKPSPAKPGVPKPGKPHIKLNSLSFLSDHGSMKHNDGSWDDSGKTITNPEWQAGPKPHHFPISQTKGTALQVEAELDVAPATMPATSAKLSGQGILPALSFEGSGSIAGGPGQKITMTAKGSLPDFMTRFSGENIVWHLEMGGTSRVIEVSFGHEIMVTHGTPRNGVTTRRVRKGIELAEGFGNKPHDIVSGQMDRFPVYEPGKAYLGNIWPLADDIAGGAECQAIVRFVEAVNDAVGLPGKARGITVYAAPDAPDTPIVGNLTQLGGPGMQRYAARWFRGDGFLEAFLFDGADKANNYEAALEFEHGAKLFYPGGTGGTGVKTTKDVLHSFARMAWSSHDPVKKKLVPKRTIKWY